MTSRPVEAASPISESPGQRRIRAVTLDYWNTLVDDIEEEGERKTMRRDAIRALLEAYDYAVDTSELHDLYSRAGREAVRWWVDVSPPEDCEHLAAAVAVIDDALLAYPPPLFHGAVDLLSALASRVPLAIISDTGFASGHGQNRVLDLYGVREHFAATIYSGEIGHCKPRAEPFNAALQALDIPAHEVVHIGDIEQTDVQGALAMGMRAVRLDLKEDNGPSAAEYVARSYQELLDYLSAHGL
jgi:FMN phosphatase YigB (HAD superfamily)